MDISDAQNQDARPRDDSAEYKGSIARDDPGHSTSNFAVGQNTNGVIQNNNETNPSSPEGFKSLDGLVISPASSSLGASPPRDFTSYHQNGEDAGDTDGPINPFRLDFDGGERNNFENNGAYDDSNNINDGDRGKYSDEPQQNNNINSDKEKDTSGRESPTLSLNLSVMSGYDTEEDEDGVLRRYGSHVLASTKNAIARIRSDDDEDSVYSAINQSADTDDPRMNVNGINESNRIRINSSQSSLSRSSSTSGGGRRKQKSIWARIRSVFNGMRRAHEDARLQRSTQRFLAMSEGQRTAQGWTESICLSPWCDVNTGRGVALMLGALSLCILVAGALGKGGHISWGVWIIVIGVTIILIKAFWVPIHWLVVGQFAEKRRRQNMQVYETLNGGNPGGIEIPVQHFEREEFSFENEIAGDDVQGSPREVV